MFKIIQNYLKNITNFFQVIISEIFRLKILVNGKCKTKTKMKMKSMD